MKNGFEEGSKLANPLASVIVITWNRVDYTKLCIYSILEKTIYEPYELIVVDNNSTDGTVKYLLDLHQMGKIQKLILLDKNYGAGYAMNRGIERAEGSYLIRSDNDMVYNQGWLTGLVDSLKRIPQSLLQVAVYGELVQDGRRGGFRDVVNGVRLNQVSIGGCNMAFTRLTFDELGPFEETKFAEDGVFCHIAQQKGYVVGQIDAVTGTHIDNPGCKLSKRYSKYAEERYQMLEELRQEGYDFLWEEDRKFFEEFERGKVFVEGSRNSLGNQHKLKILYVTSGMEQNYPHKFIDQFIARSLESISDAGEAQVFELNIHTDWQAKLLALIEKYNPEYVFTLHGCHMTSDCVERIKSYGAKTGIWFVDDPYDLDESKERLYGYDYIFTNEEGCVPIYQKLGYKESYNLALGVGEQYYFPEPVIPKSLQNQYSSDICFVGSPFPKRVELLQILHNHFPEKVIRVIGPFWQPLLPRGVEVVNHHVTPEEVRKYYSNAKIVLNIHREYNEHLYSLQNLNQDGIRALSLNNRTFDIAACKVFQLVDERKSLAKYYDLQSEIVTYANSRELIQKIRYYLKRSFEMKRIAMNAYQRTMEEHRMCHRLEEMFRLVEVKHSKGDDGRIAEVTDRNEATNKEEQVTIAIQPLEVGQVLARLSEGSLIKGERSAVYLLLDGWKYLIPDVQTFQGLGLRWEDVDVVGQKEVDQVPNGGRLKSLRSI